MTEAMQILVGLIADSRSKLKRVEDSESSEVRPILDAALERLQRALHRNPVVLIAGEANSGKTSVANLLAGLDVLPSAVIANTAVPLHLKHGVIPSVSAKTSRGEIPLATLSGSEPLPKFLYSGLERINVDLPIMRDAGFEILDTPGSHGTIEFSDEADVVLWCSVAARPWTESERRAVSTLPARLRDRSLLVITHKDTLSPAEAERVLARYKEVAGTLFSGMVMIDASARNIPSDDSGTDALEMFGALHPADADAATVLSSSLDEIIEDFWDHRAITGRRLCRHIARSLKPVLPTPAINGGSPSTRDPLGTLLSNIAGRLATI